MQRKTTNRFLQQHISYHFYLKKHLACQAATTLSYSSFPPLQVALWLLSSPELGLG